MRRPFAASRHQHRLTLLVAAALACSCSDGNGDACELEDADGVIGGEEAFIITVDDDGFSPNTVTAQNKSTVRLTLRNEGKSDAGFMVDCLPTPNEDGCAQESCFPASSTIDPVAPGEEATTEFVVPEVEGLYTFRALAGDDERLGDFRLN